MELFSRIQPTGQQVSRREFVDLQSRLERVVNAVALKPWNNGVHLTAVDLVSGVENYVSHTLGRAFVSWFLADPQSGVLVWRNVDTAADPLVYLSLTPSVSATVQLVVF